mgnify:CR=1 FL=1
MQASGRPRPSRYEAGYSQAAPSGSFPEISDRTPSGRPGSGRRSSTQEDRDIASKAIKITDVQELGDVMISQLSGLFENKKKLN